VRKEKVSLKNEKAEMPSERGSEREGESKLDSCNKYPASCKPLAGPPLNSLAHR